MSKKCDICGKGPMFGHNVSHANNKTNPNFANSAGWKEKPATLNHPVVPLTVSPKNNTNIKSRRDRRYIILENDRKKATCKTLANKKTTKPITKAVSWVGKYIKSVPLDKSTLYIEANPTDTITRMRINKSQSKLRPKSNSRELAFILPKI